MTVSVDDVRSWPLNDMPASDIADQTITDSIDMAEAYVASVKRADADSGNIDRATKALAGYLAYLAYLDRPVDNVAGAFTNGYFQPAEGTKGIPQVKSMSDVKTKVKYLKEITEWYLGLISSVIEEGPQQPRLIPYASKTIGR